MCCGADWSGRDSRLKGEFQPRKFKKAKSTFAVVADGFNRAAFLCLVAKGFFFRSFRLLLHVRISAIVVTCEICRGGFPAQIAINALVIDVKFARDVILVAICNVCHIFELYFSSVYRGRNVKDQETFDSTSA